MKQFSKELGKVSITPKGNWDSSTTNERLDIVYDRRNNQAYIAKQDVPIGVDIDNREYWQPLNVSGYADNNFINLTAENENGTITAYESLEEAIATIFPINRRVGATLSFYNLNSDRLDRQAEFELWQFNSTDLANWENKDYWNNIYYNWNVFAGWYIDADALNNHVNVPNVGQYAYVGSNLNDAILYQCRTNGTWTNTGIKVRNYISVVVSGNITIGENGNWFSDGKDTGIPATPAVDEQLDNIIMRLQQHDVEISNLKKSNANLQDQITSNDSDIINLTAKHESLSKTVQGIAATGGASTATNVTYDNDASGLNAENAQDAIDELQGSKVDKVSIMQELGESKDKVVSQYALPFREIESPEFIKAIVDAEDHFLFGIQFDGSIEWGKGIPSPIRAKLQEIIEALNSANTKLSNELSDARKYIKVNLYGKKISILGDSLSTFKDNIPSGNVTYYPNDNNDITLVEQTWWMNLINNSNAKLEINNSFSGSKVSGSEESSYTKRVENLGNPDYIIIHGGTNDIGQNVPVGTLHFDLSTDNLNKNEFADSYDLMIRKCRELYPNANIILVIPHIVSVEYTSIIEEISAHYNLFGIVNLHESSFVLVNGHYQIVDMQTVSSAVSKVLYNNKNVLREEGKSLIEDEVKECFRIIENEEFFKVIVDSDDKVVLGIKRDGQIIGEIHNVKSETILEEFEHIEDPEGRIEITTDVEGKLLGYRDSEGTRHEHKISANHINLSNEAAKEVNEAFKSAGIKMENPSDFSKDSYVELPIPRIAAQVRLYASKLPTTKTDDIKAEIEYNDKDGNYFRKPIVLNAQGSSSMQFYVKNLAIDLDDRSKIKFGYFPSQDSFHIKKYYIDVFRGQCIVGYRFMEQVYQTRPFGKRYPYEYSFKESTSNDGLGSISKDFLTGARCHPDGFPVSVTFINTETNEKTEMGIYAWNLKKSREVFYMDKKNAKNIHLDGKLANDTIFAGTINWAEFEIRNPKSLINIDGEKYDGDNPNELSNDDSLSSTVKNYIIRLSKAKSEIEKANSKEKFEEYFYVEPFIDYYLASQLAYNLDGFSKNWQFTTWDGNHWCPCAYDWDSIWGSFWNGTYIVNGSDISGILGKDVCFGLDTLYDDEIKKRYKELRDAKIFSVDNIVKLMQNWLDTIGYENIQKELELYTDIPSYRSNQLNEGWKLRQYSWEANTYDPEKTYSVGEICIYGCAFEATKEIKGIPPLKSFYEHEPKYYGCYNSIQRIANWLTNRIKFLDSIYEYNV